MADGWARHTTTPGLATPTCGGPTGPMIIDSRISRAVINLPMRRVLYGKDE